MRVLIGCEESQAVCKEFRAKGHEAYSCDILPCSGGHPEWHLQEDLIKVMGHGTWDMGIFFPPCTDLAVSGAAWFERKRKDGSQQKSIDFFMTIAKWECPKKAIENPVGIMSKLWRKPDQIINPFNFGDPFQKHTCLWLTGLPRLIPTFYDAPLFGLSVDRGQFKEWTCKKSGKVKRQAEWYCEAWGKPTEERRTMRSKTFPGIARAMAEQWG